MGRRSTQAAVFAPRFRFGPPPVRRIFASFSFTCCGSAYRHVSLCLRIKNAVVANFLAVVTTATFRDRSLQTRRENTPRLFQKNPLRLFCCFLSLQIRYECPSQLILGLGLLKL